MKKRIPTFLAGAATALLLSAMCTAALAAAGRVSYNFAGVAVNGAVKITAGEDITAPNGQRVPGSILYTDEAGGKTNYLPIRAISELLEVEVSYDSATRTVYLGRQPIPQPSQTLQTARRWTRRLEGGQISYTGPQDLPETVGRASPAWHLTWLPEGYALTGLTTRDQSGSASWTYEKGGDKWKLTWHALSGAHVGMAYGLDVDTASFLRPAAVNGRDADFYQCGEDGTELVWEDAEGNLFWLSGTLDQASMERIAAGVTMVEEPELRAYQLGWTPAGSAQKSRCALTGAVEERWSTGDGVNFSWLYGTERLAAPAGTGEQVTVQDRIAARYWAGDTAAAGGVTVSVGDSAIRIPGAEQESTLLWTSADGVCFRIQGMLDRDTMLRMAESVI